MGVGENDDDLLLTESIRTAPKSLLGMSPAERAQLDADAERLVSEAVVDEVVPLNDGTERVTYEVMDMDVACNGGGTKPTPPMCTSYSAIEQLQRKSLSWRRNTDGCHHTRNTLDSPTTVTSCTPRPQLCVDTQCLKPLATTSVCIPVYSTRMLRLLLSASLSRGRASANERAEQTKRYGRMDQRMDRWIKWTTNPTRRHDQR